MTYQMIQVRTMSGMRSTAMIKPTPSSGRPMALRTMVIIARPAMGTAAANAGEQCS